MQAAQRKIDLNSLLMGANLLVLGLIVFQASRQRGNVYTNDETMLLGVLLCLQTQAALILERLQRDPFVILFAFSMIFYYSLRIFTLSLFDYSDVFPRFPFSVEDTNFALIYILIANLCLYAGLFGIQGKGSLSLDVGGWKATSSGRVVIVLVLAIVFSYLGGALWAEGGMPRVFVFIVLLLSPSMLAMLVLTYFILFRKTLGIVAGTAMIGLVLLEVVVHTISGSRSAFVGLVQTLLLVMLALWGRIKFSRWLVGFGIVAAPILLAVLVFSFAVSTYARFARESGDAPDLERTAEFVAASSNDPLIVGRLTIMAPYVASRAGFFDFSAELIAHRGEYASVFNARTYFRSIVDNVLTPGLDLFDQPKIANSLQFIYERWGTPSKTYVVESYHSDQIGIYGEFFVLFGWASLPLLFLITLLFKRIYVRLSSPNPYVFAMKRVVVLYVFVRTIDCFGMDWTVTDAVAIVLAVFVYTKCFTSRRISSVDSLPSGYAVAR
jgi:hypothetical protein